MSEQQTSTAQDVTYVAQGTSRVSCNGGGGALGHPLIWLNLVATDDASAKSAICPYCSHQFVERAQ